MEDDLNFLENGRQPQKKIMQPKTIKIKTMVVAPLRVTWFFLIAPSLDSLQEMIKTCEQYASEHNLKFSVNANPRKCKNIAFLNRERELGPVVLSGVME